MVEVFKTNVQEAKQAKQLTAMLFMHFPGCKIHFDLEDCDKILRIESKKINTKEIIWILNTNGFFCEELSD